MSNRNQMISANTEYVPRNDSLQNPNVMRHMFRRSSVNNDIATTHPSFRSKAVCALNCLYCTRDICGRGMKAILLADTKVININKVELYSTDQVNSGYPKKLT